MSNKLNDIYNEELERAKEDYEDAKKAMANAEQEYKDAVSWRESRSSWLNECAKRLFQLKDKEI